MLCAPTETENTVVLNVLVGADQTLVGLSVNNHTIISMSYDDLFALVARIYGPSECNRFSKTLSSHHIPPNSQVILLKTTVIDTADSFVPDMLLSALKLYRSGDIYSCYSVNYRYKDGIYHFGGIGDTLKYTHAIGLVPAHFTLTDVQKSEFPTWYNTTYKHLILSDRSDKYRTMIRMYDTSYFIGICEAEYIMLFSILEMIFGSGHSEITYQISRGVALLLSKTPDEMHEINSEMKKLYTSRSGFVHGGSTISCESLYSLREYVRKVLLKVAELGYHTNSKSFKELQGKILLGGYNQFSEAL